MTVSVGYRGGIADVLLCVCVRCLCFVFMFQDIFKLKLKRHYAEALGLNYMLFQCLLMVH